MSNIYEIAWLYIVTAEQSTHALYATAYMEDISMVAGSGPAALKSTLIPTMFFTARVNPDAARFPNVLSA